MESCNEKKERQDETFNQSKIYDLAARKIMAKKIVNQYLSSIKKNEELLDKAMSLDDTLPDIYFQKLLLKPENKLKEKSYDIMDKNDLKKFGINKINNFKELYFYVINYIESIILEKEENNAVKGFEKEEFEQLKNENIDIIENESNSDSENNKDNIINCNINDFSFEVCLKEKNYLDENLSDSKFKEVLENKENFNIK